MADTHNMVLVSIDWLDSLATQIKALQGERDEAVRLLRRCDSVLDAVVHDGALTRSVKAFLARIGGEADYIAAADPSTILALLARVRAAEAVAQAAIRARRARDDNNRYVVEGHVPQAVEDALGDALLALDDALVEGYGREAK